MTKNPSFNATVAALTVTSSTVYAGGYFTTVNGVTRSRLAAVQAVSGALTSWAPRADSTVRALTITGDKTKVIAGGHFNFVNDLSGRGLVALDAVTGARRTWKINGVVRDYGTDAAIFSLAADASTVYGTGYAFGGGNFEGVFAADDTVGDVRWLQDCHGDTYDVAQTAGAIYSVGHPHFCGNLGGFPETGQSNPQRTLAMTRTARGTLAHNTEPGRSADFGGQPAPSLYNWFPALNSGTYTGLGQGAWTVAASTSYVVLAGEFTQVNGRAQQGIVRFTLPSKQNVRRGPEDRSAATAPTVVGGANGTARVTWRANWDRDEMPLSYDVLRDGVAVGRVSRASTFWNRPTVAFTDQGLVAGRTYRYQIRALHRVDPVTSPAVSFTYAAAAAAEMDAGVAAQQVQPRQLSGPLTLTAAQEAVATTDADEAGSDALTLELRVRSRVAGGTLAAFGPQGSCDPHADGLAGPEGPAGVRGYRRRRRGSRRPPHGHRVDRRPLARRGRGPGQGRAAAVRGRGTGGRPFRCSRRRRYRSVVARRRSDRCRGRGRRLRPGPDARRGGHAEPDRAPLSSAS